MELKFKKECTGEGSVVHYLFGLPGKFVFGFSWLRVPKKHWIDKDLGVLPFLWAGKHLSGNSVVYSVHIGRLGIRAGFKWKCGEDP
jgi:hypothetical protein